MLAAFSVVTMVLTGGVAIAAAAPRATPAGVDLARVGSAPTAPHTNVAAIYDEFGLRADDQATLGKVADDLAAEGYHVKRYRDTTEGAGSRGSATLANFVNMAKRASVIVINTHAFDPAAETQDCIGGKGFVGYGEPVVPPVTSSNVQACSALDQPILQVEWYPTEDAVKQARRKYVAAGYKDEWFAGPVVIGTNIDPRPGDQIALDENNFPAPARGGQRPALFLTASGIAHFFGNKHVDIVDVMACQSMAFAPAFDARTFFGHERTACSNKESVDEVKLFDRLSGRSGVEYRSTTAAFDGGGFADEYFQMAPSSKPVVLSPAVADASPSDGGGLTGRTTPVTLKFDAKMAKSPPKRVVTASGCDASIANAGWSGNDRFNFELKVPKVQPGKTITLTVHHEAARSAGGYPHKLDGNQDPGAAGESGVAPNGDDYVWHVSCAPSTKFKMVYTGTYEYKYLSTNPQLAPVTESGSYTWTQTQVVEFGTSGPRTSTYDSTTTLDASGTTTLDHYEHMTCDIKTPSGYGWAVHRVVAKHTDTTPVSFAWGIVETPHPGAKGVTGGAGGSSGCTSTSTGFDEIYGIEPSALAGFALDDAQTETLGEAMSGSTSFLPSKLPQTKHIDVDATKSETQGPTTRTGTVTFHGTMTFSKL